MIFVRSPLCFEKDKRKKRILIQWSHWQRTPPGSGQGPCVSLGFLYFRVFLIDFLAFSSYDGKRLRACEKRLELLWRAKPKIGGCQGEAPGLLGAATDFSVIGIHFRLKTDQQNYQISTPFVHCFQSLLELTHLGTFWEAKIDPRWAKLGSRRLSKRYCLKNTNVHEHV